MGVDFYYMPLSPPCRSALLAAKAFGIKLDCKLLNLMAGEHMKPDFLAINPQHHIPTINDNGFILWESRAIIQYFANSSPNGEHLYPKEPGKRALVDQRMYFDLGTLYERFYQFAIPFMFGREPALNPEKKAKVEEALSLLDGFIEKSGGWVAGDKMTIADFACVASVATIEETGVLNIPKYKNICQWLAKCKAEMKGYPELNHDGAQQFGHIFKSKLEAASK